MFTFCIMTLNNSFICICLTLGLSFVCVLASLVAFTCLSAQDYIFVWPILLLSGALAVISLCTIYKACGSVTDITPIEGSYVSEYLEGQSFYADSATLQITYRDNSTETISTDDLLWDMNVLDTRPLKPSDTSVRAVIADCEFNFPITVRAKSETTVEETTVTSETIETATEAETIILNGHVYRKET